MRTLIHVIAAAFGLSAVAIATAMADPPHGLPVPGGDSLGVVHAEGAQVYECVTDGAGGHTWQFREPIATLLRDGKTIGRHYLGPRWEFDDGTSISARVVAQSVATHQDIPHLMLTVIDAKGGGPLAGARTLVRINTKGGMANGACSTPGAQLSVPYAADYAFFAAVRDN